MNPTSLDEVRAINSRTNNLLGLLNTLLETNRPQLVQRIVYTGAKYYLQQLMSELEQIAWQLALEEIQQIIQNTPAPIFDGAYNGQQIALARMEEIRDALRADCLSGDLECLVEKTQTFVEIDTAVKQRILSDVKAIVPTYDPTDSIIRANIQAKNAQEIYNSVPFIYDRVNAAQYAIDISRTNFEVNFPYGAASLSSCNISGLSVSNGVGSTIRYSFLRHVGANNAGCVQSTGSACFVSETLYCGGKLPMFCEDVGAFNCGTDVGINWLICKTNGSSTNFEATNNWRDHFGLLRYFSEIHDIPPFNSSNFVDVPVGLPPELNPGGSDIGIQTYMYLFSGGDNGKWRSQQAQLDGQAHLYTLFKQGNLADLETGDYVFLYLGDPLTYSSHGLLIVGWGEAVEADIGLNANRANTISLYSVRPRDSQNQPLNYIPYVADFAYGYDSGYVGWLQDPRPRPFYAILAELNNTQLENIASRLGGNGYSPQNDFQQDYLARFQTGSYRRFATAVDPLNPNRIPSGWYFFHFPDNLSIPFESLFPTQAGIGCA